MALKVLLMRNKAAMKKKLLEELRSKDEGFRTREQELEASIAEMDESTPEADRKVVEDAVEDLTKEKDAHEAEKKKLEDEIEELENKIKEQESTPPEPQAGDDQGASQNSRSKRGKDRDMETRTEFFGRTMQERSAIFANEEVKDFMQQVRSCIKEKRAIGNAGLIIPQNFLPMIKEVTEANSKLLKYTNKSDITGTARITIMGSVPEAVWTEQCGKLNELELGFNDVEMDGFKVAGFFKVCNALLEDNDVNLAQELINALGIAIAKAKDKAIVYGTGVKMPMGIVTRLAQTVKPSDHNDTEREWKDLHESNIKKIENKTGKELFKEIVRCLKMIFTDYDSGNLVWMMNRQTKLDLVVEAMDTNMNATIVSGMNDTMPVVGGKVEELKFMADGDIAFGYMTNYKEMCIRDSMLSDKKITIRTNKIRNETIEKMRSLGVYREEFNIPIQRYADMRMQYDILCGTWRETGCKVTEKYTNKAGATNIRKAPLYLSMENLRRELIEMENLFGLTPKGFKAIKAKGLDQGKKSVLGEALERLERKS